MLNADEILQLQKARAEASPWITVDEIAATYKITVRQLRRWEKAGVMPPRVKRSRWWMYGKQAVAELMTSRRKSLRYMFGE